MEWLEATLAFAVVMMIFATFVSMIIEALHRVTRIREDGLRSMMTQVYDKIVQPGSSQDKQPPGFLQTKKEFVDSMTETRLLPLTENASWLRKYIYKRVNAQRLMSLPTEKFLQRFIEANDGKQLIIEAAQHGRAHAEETLKSIAGHYEDFGDSARDFFTRRSRFLSTLIAILLAISVNLDALELFKTFLEDKGVRQAMIERGNAVVTELQQAEAALQDAKAMDGGGDGENLDSITGKIENLQTSIADLKAAGIPIGWERVPWKTSSYQAADGFFSKALIILTWVFSVLLGGVLVGLGGPFWFNIFRKLGSFAGASVGSQQETKPNSPQQEHKSASQKILLDRVLQTPLPEKIQPHEATLSQSDNKKNEKTE